MRQILLPFFQWRVCWPYKQRELDRFEAWCRSGDDEERIYWDGDAAADASGFRRVIATKLAHAEGVPSILGLPIQMQDIVSNEISVELYKEISNNPQLYVELSSEVFAEPRRFGEIKIIGDGKQALTLRNACIRRLEADSVSDVHIEDCQIGDLRVHPEHKTADYRIQRSMIGKFVVVNEKDKAKEKEERGYHVQDLEWEGGYLGQFDLWQDKTRAFVGNASFHRITLPRTYQPHRVQWLRDVREALTARNNLVAAGIFHASELKLSRHKGGVTHWLFSWAYEAVSNFGNSILRPIVCFLMTLLALATLAYVVGTEVTRPDELKGWQRELKEDQCSAQLLRAAVYAVQSINPLNLFASQPLIVMCSKLGALAGFILSISGIAAVALFLLSLRRRFKLE
jgi:hypothetical protein